MKKLFLTLGVVLAATLANASILYWQLDTSDYTGDEEAAYATLNVTEGGTPGTVYGLKKNETTGEFEAVEVTELQSGATYYIDTEDWGGDEYFSSDYSYYVELYNSSDEKIDYTGYQVSGEEFYNYASTGGTTDLGDIDPASVAVFHSGSNMTVVPEPTSAILMLFGAAFLGLKRKNRSLA